jgi:NADH:ubiquinone oxidoreductase subunit
MQKKKYQVGFLLGRLVPFPFYYDHFTTHDSVCGYPLKLDFSGRHRWVDLAQVRCFNKEQGQGWSIGSHVSHVRTVSCVANACLFTHYQHEYNASQVPPEWHSWISHIRKDPPTEDKAIQRFTPPWKSVGISWPSIGAYSLNQTR